MSKRDPDEIVFIDPGQEGPQRGNPRALCFPGWVLVKCVFFFFKQKTAYEVAYGDWSSDVCSSDLSDICASIWVFKTRMRNESEGVRWYAEVGIGPYVAG